jgi:penicillin-binding protein 1C
MPKGCESRMVCSETGLLPSDHCHNLVMDYFIPLISSTTKCNNIQEVLVSADEKISYCKNCAPKAGYKKKIYKVIEPEMQAWYEDQKVAYEKIPTHNPSCEIIFIGNAPSITSPANGSEYLISTKRKEPIQLTCKTATDVSKVFWYIDDKFYKASTPGEKQFFVPDEGPVKISCTDDKGRNRDIKILVRYVNL